jgi:hypothetical protein
METTNSRLKLTSKTSTHPKLDATDGTPAADSDHQSASTPCLYPARRALYPRKLQSLLLLPLRNFAFVFRSPVVLIRQLEALTQLPMSQLEPTALAHSIRNICRSHVLYALERTRNIVAERVRNLRKSLVYTCKIHLVEENVVMCPSALYLLEQRETEAKSCTCATW